ncbi:MAG: J domain-containing protein [Lachnospiraceae bacterium]|uniref:J domain-containing protein n=1 Tax=uncultured Acetatifactor sp. TaxID=1671927 RepID=UPI0026122A54|nr:J domain-containing protein [uncultured Acetatifactor sp.]MCI8790218.1 J domain-containing protein [Lachnospiraceae bacterium]
MKSDIWTFLGIAPTSDKKTIRSAYAAQSRLHHPEEEPEYFVELNQAYRQALSLARTAEADGSSENRISRSGEEDRNSNHTEFTQLNTGTGNEKDKEESASLLERLADARQKAIQQSMETGALHDFITLFTNPKQAKAADTWKRFFLSEAFLREQYTEDFARGLYTYLMEQQLHPCDNLPAGLLQELAIAYALIPHFAGEEYGQGMKYPKEWYKVSVEQTLPARKQIAEIFNRQGWDCDLKSMTRRMLKQPANKVRHNAFTDYLTLKEMGQKGQLTEADKETWQHILGFGQVHYLYERNGKRLGGADYESRSECVVKLYVQWLKDQRLPDCVLKFLYQKFSFRELDRSSTRGLYGALKEQVLVQLPQVEELLFGQDGLEQKVTKVYRVCSRIINDNQNNYEKSIYEETPEIKERVEALFAMPEWKEVQKDRGLFDRLYAGAKRLVMPRSLTEGLIRSLEQGDFPEPRRTELLESLLRSLATEQMCREIDYRFQLSFPPVDMERLEDSPEFWQYYLMRGYGFRHGRIRGEWEDGYLYEMDGECYLPAYIRHLYAPSKAWQKAFTGFCQETESIPAPVSATCTLPDGRTLRVEFHYHFCLYFVEEAPVLFPVLTFGELRRWASEHGQAQAHISQTDSEEQSGMHAHVQTVDSEGRPGVQAQIETTASTQAARVQDFFFMLGVTAIELSERKEAEELIQQWLGKLPLHPHICPLVARLLAADNDRLPSGTKAIYYEEQERFCFRAVVSGEGIRIYRQMEFGWEDRIFRRAEFGWKELPWTEMLWKELYEKGLRWDAPALEGTTAQISGPDAEAEKAVREILQLLRQPKPVRMSAENLEGMDLLQKAQAILKSMGFPEDPEGYCVLRYGRQKERRHDKVFYAALSPFGFPIAVHSTEHERTLRFHMDVARTKIKEGKRYIGRFGWGFKYSTQSDYGPLCVYQGDSGTFYADGAIKMYRADSLDKLLADYLAAELEGVTEVETYEGLLTVSRLDHRLEYCYRETDFQQSVQETRQTAADYFTVFGGCRLWETFARWLDAALEKGLPDWVNVLTISQALGNREGEGSVLSLTASHVEELNLDLLELQERLLAEDSRRDFHGESQEEEEGEKPGGEQRQEEADYPLEAPCLVWGKGFPVQTGRQSFGDVVRWYMEERMGEGAKLLRNRSIRVEIVDQMTTD